MPHKHSCLLCPGLKNMYDSYRDLKIGRIHIQVWISVFFFPHKKSEGLASLGPDSYWAASLASIRVAVAVAFGHAAHTATLRTAHY